MRLNPQKLRNRFLIAFLLISSSLQADWISLEKGFDYREDAQNQAHYFRIDPQVYRFDLLMASDWKTRALSARSFRERSRALLTINGGFFDEKFRSLGLLKRRGETLNPLRSTSWGIFVMGGESGKTPAVISRRDWLPERGEMAIQVGPRLIVDGKIPAFKEGPPARRSSIGVTQDGKIEIGMIDSPVTLGEWASMMKKDCVEALNLDGGGSSQISVQFSRFSREILGFTDVPNAIAVFR